MKLTRMFVIMGALVLLGAATGFAYQQYQHVTQPLAFYDNAPGTDFNTMILEQPSIVIDGYNEGIKMGPGGSTAPLEVLAPGAAAGDLYVGGAGYVTTIRGATVLSTWQAWDNPDTSPDVSGYSYFTTNAAAQTLVDFDGTGIAAGHIIVVESTGAVTYDVTGQGLICGDTDVVTADGDVTMWVYNGTDWQCLAFLDIGDDNNTWGAT